MLAAGQMGLWGVKFSLTEINDKLDDLKTGNPFLPPDSDAARALEIVPVHDNVDHQVQGDHGP
jgi:hypothetical protein